MNIVYSHRTRCSGADGTHIKGVIKGFENLNNKVFVIAPKVSIGTVNSAKKNNNKPVLLRLPRVVFEMLELLYNIPAFYQLHRGYRQHKYDLIYERYSFLNVSGFLLSRVMNIPLLLEVNFTTKTQVYPERTGMFKSLTRQLERAIFKKASLIIVISEVLKTEIANNGIEADKILVLPNAVDIEKFQPREPIAGLKTNYNMEKNDKIIGFVGSFYPWHGIDFLIDTYKELLPEYNGVSLMLLGDGQMAEQLKKQVQAEGLGKKVIFTGKIPHDTLPAYLSIFDIGIMPDSNDYGSPMKIFEYMAMGKPIVAPLLKPIAEVIENGREGILFKQRNKPELKKALLQLLNNTELCKKMGEAGRAKVLSHHTWDLNAKRIIEYMKIPHRGNEKGF
jgi:glycosyltransferase involved in cell wall biosynthesis